MGAYNLNLRITGTLATTILCLASPVVMAVPSCPVTSDPPTIYVTSPAVDAPVSGLGALRAIVDGKGDQIESVDVYVGETPADAIAGSELLPLAGGSNSNKGGAKSEGALVRAVHAGLENKKGEIWLRPGVNKMTLQAWTKKGKCGQRIFDVRAELSNVYAVIVGISDYAPEGSIKKLAYAHADAISFAEHLEKTLSVPHENIHVLLNKDALVENITGTLEELVDRKITESDTIIFYFAGHGFRGKGIPYLTSYTAKITRPGATMIPIETIRKTLANSTAGRRVVFIDACYVGSGENTRAIVDPLSSGGRGLTDTWSKWKGSFGIISSSDNQISYEANEFNGGVFTHFLLEAFKKAPSPDGKDEVTLIDAFKYVETEVKKYVADKWKDEQEPQLFGTAGNALNMYWGIRETRPQKSKQ